MKERENEETETKRKKRRNKDKEKERTEEWRSGKKQTREGIKSHREITRLGLIHYFGIIVNLGYTNNH